MVMAVALWVLKQNRSIRRWTCRAEIETSGIKAGPGKTYYKNNEYSKEYSVFAYISVCAVFFFGGGLHMSLGSCPDLLQKPPSATEHLFIFRFKQQQRAASWDKELPSAPMPGISSSPLAHFTGIHLPSCSAGIQSKISAQSLARISFSLAGLWKFQQRKHVNITSSKTPHK